MRASGATRRGVAHVPSLLASIPLTRACGATSPASGRGEARDAEASVGRTRVVAGMSASKSASRIEKLPADLGRPAYCGAPKRTQPSILASTSIVAWRMRTINKAAEVCL